MQFLQILLVYDITKRESYNKILDLMKLSQGYLDNKKVLFGLIGNKTDLYHLHAVKMSEHAQVDTNNIYIYNTLYYIQLSESQKMKSFFMSAKTGDQISDCFISIAGELAGVNVNVKTNTLGNQQLSTNHNNENDNISEDDEDDDSEEERNTKKKNSAQIEKTQNSDKKQKNSNSKKMR